MNIRTPFLFIIVLLFFLNGIHAQRFEIHAIKDFSNNETAHKAWGVGAAVDLDQWVKNVIFRPHFDWAFHKPTNDLANNNYQRFCGGISALYSYKIKDKISIQGGVGLNYTHLRHSYIFGYEPVEGDTTSLKFLTVLHTGSFIGIGAHVGARYELGKRLSVVLNFVPTYLITVGNKSSTPQVTPEYNKGLWLFPLQLGLSYKFYQND